MALAETARPTPGKNSSSVRKKAWAQTRGREGSEASAWAIPSPDSRTTRAMLPETAAGQHAEEGTELSWRGGRRRSERICVGNTAAWLTRDAEDRAGPPSRRTATAFMAMRMTRSYGRRIGAGMMVHTSTKWGRAGGNRIPRADGCEEGLSQSQPGSRKELYAPVMEKHCWRDRTCLKAILILFVYISIDLHTEVQRSSFRPRPSVAKGCFLQCATSCG